MNDLPVIPPQGRRSFLIGTGGLLTTIAAGAALGSPEAARAAPSTGGGAIDAPNRQVESKGRTLAYRSIGEGVPLVLCMRFRGNMDLWDPLFLDSLAAQGFRVITFDYTGLGLSTGTPNYDPAALAQDVLDLIDALGLDKVVIGGWSLGGMAAQVFLAMWPARASHVVLIGCGPPMGSKRLAEQLFYDTARIPDYTVEHETILFFEPRSPASRAAAEASHRRIAQRTKDRSNPVPLKFATDFLGTTPHDPSFPAPPVLEALKNTTVPVLHIGGDHDISFPIENWYALNGQLPTVQLLTFPRSGHGPQHEHPEECARVIRSFIEG